MFTNIRKENRKRKNKVRFTENVKQPMEACILCTIDGEMFHSFTKNTWIGNSGASCHITNDDTGLYNVTNIKKLLKGSLGNMSIAKKASYAQKYIKSMVAKSNTYYGL